MPRPVKCRNVCRMPENLKFIPQNPGENQEPVILNLDEFETIRLIDREGFSQEQCGRVMGVARATVQQIYTAARKKVADALVDGRPLQIEGGQYRLCGKHGNHCGCQGCWRHLANRGKKEDTSMKIVIPLDENKQDICVSFGRAPYFLFSQDGNQEILENPAAQAQGGAGLKAAQFVVDNGADVLITVRCGQNAADVFTAAEMKIYKAEGSSAQGNLTAFEEKKLEPLTHFHAGFQGIG